MSETIMKHGGARPGSGRPIGTGKFREKTRPLRIPESLIPQVTEMLEYYAEGVFTTSRKPETRKPREYMEFNDNVYRPIMETTQALPFYSSRVAAGFPSPADDHLDTELDLNEHLIKHPAATFFVRVRGDSMLGAGIHENDILIVDRSLKPTHGKVIIAIINGELTVKRLHNSNGQIRLVAENGNYPSIIINESMDFSIWGVVTSVIHTV